MANNAIKQITIRRGNDHGGIDINTYNIGGSDSIDAVNVNYDDTVTQLGVSNVQRAVEQLKSNFQGGVDAVYDAVVAKGSTPASHSLRDVIAGIGNIPTGITPTGTFVYTGNESSWIQDISVYQYANASNVYNKGYSNGYSDGATHVIQHPVWITSNVSMPISTDREDSVNVHIYNNTSNTLKILIYVTSQRGENAVHTLNGANIATHFPTMYDFPPNGDLYLYQDGVGGSDNPDGEINLVILGEYSSYENLIVWDDNNFRTTGSCTFS